MPDEVSFAGTEGGLSSEAKLAQQSQELALGLE